eukprot:6196872-Pleurochrysis_carterae.AAC.2
MQTLMKTSMLRQAERRDFDPGTTTPEEEGETLNLTTLYSYRRWLWTDTSISRYVSHPRQVLVTGTRRRAPAAR